MSGDRQAPVRTWTEFGVRMLPFADAASETLPLSRLLRLSLFQASAGMTAVLLTGTLNRVMIVEMGVAAWLVSAMVALPLVFAPLRALIGHRSDTHVSALGWRRVPYIWFGTLMQFGGLAIMPFALLVLSDQMVGPQIAGPLVAALAFLLVGAGMHTAQTAGLALASDIAPSETRPRVVALLYVMLLLGMVAAALIFGGALADYSAKRLIQVIQGAAVLAMALNVIALWKQEPRNRVVTAPDRPRRTFGEAWAAFRVDRRSGRLLVAVGLGTVGFSMQDILLEPYGGEILGLGVGATTFLTALLAGGTLIGFAIAAQALTRGFDTHRLAALGALAGVCAFAAVILSSPLASPLMFRIGTVLIGFGGGLFAVGTLTAAMDLADTSENGLALGAWGAVNATAAGIGLALGGALRDGFGGLAESGALGAGLMTASAGYSFVYHLEIGLLFAAMAAIGPLVRSRRMACVRSSNAGFGLAEIPG